MTDETRKLSEDAIKLANALSIHTTNSNKIWIVAVTLTVVTVTTNVSSGQSIKLLGFDIDANIFYPVSAYLIGFLNIAYCSAHAQAYRVSEMFNEYIMLEKNNKILVTKNFNKIDIYYSFVAPNYNRIYPLTHIIPEKFKNLFYIAFKTIADAIFIIAPLAGVIVSIWRSNLNWPGLFLIYFFFAISSIATILMLFTSFRWIFTREHAVTKKKDVTIS